MLVSTAAIAQSLRGLSFPCTKQECVTHARKRSAPREVVDLLERMPDRRFASMADVWSAIGDVA